MITLERLGMCDFMSLQMLFGVNTFTTNRALEWPLLSVWKLMSLQMTLAEERAITLIAWERSRICVGALMLREKRWTRIDLVTSFVITPICLWSWWVLGRRTWIEWWCDWGRWLVRGSPPNTRVCRRCHRPSRRNLRIHRLCVSVCAWQITVKEQLFRFEAQQRLTRTRC